MSTAKTKTSETPQNPPPDAAVKQAAEAAADRFLSALREQLVPPLQSNAGEILRGTEERVNKLGSFAVSERMKTVSERLKASMEESLSALRDQIVPALQGAAREALRESESKLNAMVTASVTEKLAALKGAMVSDVTQSVLRSLPPPPEPPPPAVSPAAELLSIASSIEASTSQSDILRALLDGSSIFCGRCAIFIVKGGNLVGWQGRGFADDSIQATSAECSAAPIAQWISEKAPVSMQESTWKATFLDREGRAHDGLGWILPLLVRDKVVAILFADAGHDGVVSVEELQLLVRSTGQWLEIVATRKASPIEVAPQQPTATPAEALAVAPAKSAAPTMSPAEEELHRKAQRFAKLLVDEIKLYNQAKVTEGRNNRDLYHRLRDDIEKSRATYDKRYAGTPAEAGNYFQSEVVRILAENDTSIMGSDFPR